MLKKSLFIAIGIITFSHSLFAVERYVSEELSAYVRSGPGDQYRILGTLKAGEPVTLLSEKGQYSQIKDAKQREVWILTSELSKDKSSKTQVPALKSEIEILKQQLNNIDENWKNRVANIQQLSEQAHTQSTQLIEQNSLLKQQLDAMNEKNREYEVLLNAEKQSLLIRWFMYGGSVMLVGLILGLILPRLIPRRRNRGGWA